MKPFALSSVARGLVLLVLLAACGAASGQDIIDEDLPKPIPLQSGQVFREVRSIPYSGGALYLSRGISGAFLGGKYQRVGDQSLFQWQGEVGYFYRPWFSAGLGFKINAGEPSALEQKVFNRYFINMRFHKPWTRFAVYVGPQLGLDNLNVLTGTPPADSLVGTVIEDPIRNTNAGLGLEMGMGWKFARWAGFTMGSVAEYSLVGDKTSMFGNDLNLRLIPGLAIDVLAFTDTLRELVPAFYINTEFQTGFLLLQRGRKNNDQAFLLGVSLAF